MTSELRQWFNSDLRMRCDYTEAQFRKEFADAAIGLFREYITTHTADDIPDKEIADFVEEIPDEGVSHYVEIGLRASRKRAQKALEP